MASNKRIIFILRDFPPHTSPNGTSIQSLTKRLFELHGVKSDILSVRYSQDTPKSEFNDFSRIYRVDTDVACYESFIEWCNLQKKGKSKINIVSIFLKIITHFAHLYMEKISKWNCDLPKTRMIKKAKRLIKDNSYDCMITVSNPFSVHLIGRTLRNKYSKVKWLPYVMDPHADFQGLVEKVDTSKLIKQEEMVYKDVDKILILQEVIYCSDISPIKMYKDKAVITYIPNLYDRYLPDIKNESGEIHLIYSGVFYEKIRRPEPLLELMLHLPNNYVLHLFSKGCEDIIDKYKVILNERLVSRGFINYGKLMECLNEADILINIGNTINNQVPSKVFEYISFGKPIVSFYSADDDTSIKYLKNYPCIFLTKTTDIFTPQLLSDFVDFCEKNKGVKLSFNEATSHISQCRLDNIIESIYQLI